MSKNDKREEDKKQGAPGNIPRGQLSSGDVSEGGVPPWTNGGAGNGADFLSRSTGSAFSKFLGQSSAGGGVLDGLANFLSTKLGMLLMTAAVAGASTYSLYSIYGPAATPKLTRMPVHFPKTEYSAEATKNLPSDNRGVSSLEQLAMANRAAPDQNSLAPVQGQQGAAAGTAASAAPQGSADNGSGAAAPDQNTGQVRQGMLQKVASLGTSGQAQGQSQGMIGASNGVGASKGPAGDLTESRTQHGTLTAMGGGGIRSAGIGSSRALVGGRGSAQGAQGQLMAAKNFSASAAQSGPGETKSYLADQAFSGGPSAPAGGGLPLLGSGAGAGTTGAGISPDQGGPVQQPTSSGSRPAPAVNNGTDVSPWMSMIMMATSMLMIASIIITILGFLAKPARAFPIFEGILKMLYFAAIGLAAMTMMMGIMVMAKYGQTAQGGILTAGGAILTTAALMAYLGRDVANGTVAGTVGGSGLWPMVMILSGIAGIGASIMAQMHH